MTRSTQLAQKETIIKTFIEDEMKTSYITYAMSVIVSRALPDVRDGLKPVHRRILYDMNELGLTHDKPFKKSARVVGDVLGKYHPHGDQAVYNSLVRMAQVFSMRHPLIDGQGNFGSIDGDEPAAMRYTEVRLIEIAEAMIADIEKDTVKWVPNFDDSLTEPSVLPSAIPNLLVNGSSGIAVGMATNIPPHNLRETVKAVISVIENPKITIEELMRIVPGPDFPTGGLIIGRSGIKDAYKTGNGSIKVRAKVSIESMKGGKDALVVNEIPYMVNKTKLIQDIARYSKEKRVDGITDLRDESDRDGIRVVIELKRGINPRVIMNQLFKVTPLETTFGINLLALDGLKPRIMNLKEIIECYIAHREEVVERRTRYDLDKTEKRAHILEGFLKALDHIEEIIKLIRASQTPAEAAERLIERFQFTKPQAEAILEMRLARLTGLEREKIQKEYDELEKLIAELKEILKSKKTILQQVKKELEAISRKFGNDRRTIIIAEEEEVDLKELILEEDVVVTISHNGFIKRTPITAFKHQARGGVGVNTSSLKENDFIEQMFIASTHDTLMFITNRGKAYSQMVHEIMNAGRTAKGQSIKMLLSLGEDETVAASVALRGEKKEKYILFITEKGYIKKTKLTDFKNVRKSGIIAVTLSENDTVIDAIITDGSHEIVIATAMGYALRLRERTVRDMGRGARGVTGIKLRENDYICGVTKVLTSEDLLVVTEKGYGKRITYDNFTVHGRGTRGQIYIKTNEKTGKVVGVLSISKGDAFVIITERGMVIRSKVRTVSVLGKNAGGVKLVNIKEPDGVAAVARIVQD
jgi:DNA gyrase subunit A